MSHLDGHLSGSFSWTEDREKKTPGLFSDAQTERNALLENAAVVDFSHLGVVAVSGEEREKFLSGIITNQIKKVTEGESIHTAMLSPQGRYLWDFTVVEHEDRYLLITDPDRLPALLNKFRMYLLRTKAQVEDVSDQFGVLGVIGPQTEKFFGTIFPELLPDEIPLGATFTPEAGVRLWQDPRHGAFGYRLLMAADLIPDWWQRLTEQLPPAGFESWEHARIKNSLPRGGNEMIPDTTIPTETGLVEMNGVDFTKGCYVGQETIARTHHRGTLKKRLHAITLEGGEALPVGTPILIADDKEAGILTSLSKDNGNCLGLAILRLSDVASGKPLTALGRPVTAHKPPWATWT
ncbi:MAG: folate-binding protein YgfZ [Magnetococcales bacterium]|nr:folate-binding protein YgfZ [Magnetococcales bacterium]